MIPGRISDTVSEIGDILPRRPARIMSRRVFFAVAARAGVGVVGFALVGCGKDKEPELRIIPPEGEPEAPSQTRPAVGGAPQEVAPEQPRPQAQPEAKPPTQEPAVAEQPEPQPQPEPELTPLEKAIQAGRLELNPNVENDWENYFTPVTAEEAEGLLAEANRGVTEDTKLKFLFPMDPRASKNLVIELFTINWIENWVGFGFNNIEPGTIFYANAAGQGSFEATIDSLVFEEHNFFTKLSVNTLDGLGLAILVTEGTPGPVKAEAAETAWPYNEERLVELGDPLVLITDKPVRYEQDGRLLYEAIGGIDRFNFDLPPFTNSLNEFLTRDGKIVFVLQEAFLTAQ